MYKVEHKIDSDVLYFGSFEDVEMFFEIEDVDMYYVTNEEGGSDGE